MLLHLKSFLQLLRQTNRKFSLSASLIYHLHRSCRVTQNDSLSVGELGIHNCDVPQRDVLVDEVLVHVTLGAHTLQLGPADAAGVGGTQVGAV